MEYTIKAIPTRYRGTEFRSRLEAEWAAFFDLCGWEWQYEPFDLEGWCPDFELNSKIGTRCLVEVKPENLNGWQCKDLSNTWYSKTLSHNGEFNLLLLGIGPFAPDSFNGTSIGLLLDQQFHEVDYAAFKVGNKHGISGELMGWDCILGINDCRKGFDSSLIALDLWAQAKNTVRKTYNTHLI